MDTLEAALEQVTARCQQIADKLADFSKATSANIAELRKTLGSTLAECLSMVKMIPATVVTIKCLAEKGLIATATEEALRVLEE